jgi:hypothetical protein
MGSAIAQRVVRDHGFVIDPMRTTRRLHIHTASGCFCGTMFVGTLFKTPLVYKGGR